MPDSGDGLANLRKSKIAVADGLRVGPPLLMGGRIAHYVTKPGCESGYRVGEKEAFLISRLDGAMTVEEISNEYLQRFERRLNDANWLALLRVLGSKGMLVGTEHINQPAAEPEPTDFWHLMAKYRRLRVALARMPERIERIAPRLGALFSPPFVVAITIVGIAVCAYAIARWYVLWTAWRTSPYLVDASVTASAFLWLTILAHEVAHGVAAARYGGRPREFGLVVRFPLLFAYCEVEDLFLATKRQRLATVFAGPFVSLAGTIPPAILWLLTPNRAALHAIAAAALFVTVAGALVNFLPVFRLDGYSLLNHSLGMADLRGDTYRFWGSWLRRRASFGDYPVICGAAYAGYGLLSVLLLSGVLAAAAVILSNLVHLDDSSVVAVAIASAIAGVVFMALFVDVISRYSEPGAQPSKAADRRPSVASSFAGTPGSGATRPE
jgi:putative peptide zinc metalloprotease protein